MELKRKCQGLEGEQESSSSTNEAPEKSASSLSPLSPFDLMLGQTINTDAANTLTGVVHVMNFISAHQHWRKSHNIRTKVITTHSRTMLY